MSKNAENDSTVNQIRLHSRQLVRELDVVKSSYLGTGCSFTQCHVLFELAANQSMQLLEIAEALLIDKSNASRAVKKLTDMGLVKSRRVPNDQRQKTLTLTAKGRKVLNSTIAIAQEQVQDALEHLTNDEARQVIEGMKLYSSALRSGRLQKGFELRPIEKADNPEIAHVIRTVMTEFGAVGPGYSIEDAEVDSMYENYQGEGYRYLVIEHNHQVVGGGGFAPLKGGPRKTCELRKMFFMPATRGIGMGRRLLRILLDEAQSNGYKRCYLETLDRMDRAVHLYTRNGFKPLDGPMGKTGHCSCDCWYLLKF